MKLETWQDKGDGLAFLCYLYGLKLNHESGTTKDKQEVKRMEHANEIENLRKENIKLKNKNSKLESEINDIKYKFCAFLSDVLCIENTSR